MSWTTENRNINEKRSRIISAWSRLHTAENVPLFADNSQRCFTHFKPNRINQIIKMHWQITRFFKAIVKMPPQALSVLKFASKSENCGFECAQSESQCKSSHCLKRRRQSQPRKIDCQTWSRVFRNQCSRHSNRNEPWSTGLISNVSIKTRAPCTVNGNT